MKKSIAFGLATFMAISVAACGAAGGEEVAGENIADVADEAEQDSGSLEDASSFVEENSESPIVADTDNLPDTLEEGESAMVSYDISDSGITGDLPDAEVDLAGLREQNPDVCAYIQIPGISVSSPVLKKEGDNEYYLEHGEDNSDKPMGSISMDMGNETDFTDPVTCLYGKTGEDGPFNNLVDYLDPEFMNENEFIYVYSDEYVTQYRVFASYNTEDTERLLVNYNFYDYAEYQKYIDDIFSTRDMTAVINTDLQDAALSSWNTIALIGINDDGSRQILQAVFNGRNEIR